MKPKDLFYHLTCLFFIIIIGAAVYEHLALWPSAFADLPRSLSVFQGNFKLDTSPFWIPIHPITFILFIITLLLNRRTERRRFILVPLVVYALILVITFSYFVPELLSLINMAYSDTSDAVATSRASRWELLSVVRMFLLIASAMILLNGLNKPADQTRLHTA